jgi:hypothetical protein
VVPLVALALVAGTYAAVQAARPAGRAAAAPTAPRLTAKPAARTEQTGARFAFTHRDRRVGFRCRLDGGGFAPCTSPTRYPGPLRQGTHTFAVKAVDRAGNASPATTWSWTVLAPARGFTLGGDLATLLYPGAAAPLNLRIGNPHPFAIDVRGLTVTVRSATTRNGRPNPACDGRANLRVLRQYGGRSPLTVPARRTMSLADLGVPRAHWPRLAMPDLPVNQDACKHTSFRLGYAATATRASR